MFNLGVRVKNAENVSPEFTEHFDLGGNLLFYSNHNNFEENSDSWNQNRYSIEPSMTFSYWSGARRSQEGRDLAFLQSKPNAVFGMRETIVTLCMGFSECEGSTTV